MKGKLPPAFTPESLRYCFLKWQVFWLSPIDSGLPVLSSEILTKEELYPSFLRTPAFAKAMVGNSGF